MRLTTISLNKLLFASFILLSIQLIFLSPALAASKTVVTVGKVKITEYDVKIRSNFLLIVKNKPTNSRNRANLRKSTIETLVNEQVQLQTAKKFGITILSGEVNRRIAKIAKGAKLSVSNLSKLLKSRGSHISTLKDIQESGIVWGGVIRAKFGASSQISEKLIDEEADKLGKKFGGKQTVYDLRRIVLQMPSTANKAKRNKRLADAKTVRANFQKCSRIRSLISTLGRVKVETKPYTSLSNLSSAQRSLIKKAKVGTVTGARFIKGGVEMFAVCKTTTARSNEARKYVENQLVQKKFEKFADEFLAGQKATIKIKYR